jgi:hypothetical protein
MKQLVEKLGLETHDHLQPYPLGWVRQDMGLRVVNSAGSSLALSRTCVESSWEGHIYMLEMPSSRGEQISIGLSKMGRL